MFLKISSTSNHIRKFSESFQSFPSISENFWKFWRLFWELSSNFSRLQKKIQKCCKVFLSILWQFPKFSEDLRRRLKTFDNFRKFKKTSKNAWRSFWVLKNSLVQINSKLHSKPYDYLSLQIYNIVTQTVMYTPLKTWFYNAWAPDPAFCTGQ